MCGVKCSSKQNTREFSCNPFGTHEEKGGLELVALYRTVLIS
jgi:hypothetical protein